MARRHGGVSRRSFWLGSALGLALIAGAWSATGHAWWGESVQPIDGVEWVEARRVNLDMRLVAGGDLRAVKQATIACHVEDLDDTDGTIVLSIVPNGALVKKGDELCRLDSSRYDELARLQEIEVGQARALRDQARLILENGRDQPARVPGRKGRPIDQGVRGPNRHGPVRPATPGGPPGLGRGNDGQGLSARPAPHRATDPRASRE